MFYASIFGNISSGHRTGNDQFSFQFQRREVPSNAQTTRLLYLFHLQVRLCSKSFKLVSGIYGLRTSRCTSWVLKKTEEPEIKLPTFIGSQRKQGNSRKTSASLTMLRPLIVWITTNCTKFLKRWEYQINLPISRKYCMWVKRQRLEPYVEQLTGTNSRKD